MRTMAGQMTDDDKRHLTRVIELLELAKSKDLRGVINGTLPDAEDSYALATDSVALTDYYAGCGNGDAGSNA
jgi:hypothetical protein